MSQVTLCAASSVNVKATLRALRTSLDQMDFGACKFFTDQKVEPIHADIDIVPISALNSSADYSEFLLTRLVDHIETSHCLVVQWDGHVLRGECWRPDFLNFDYIGASWPQFGDGHDVGNGGFSLRSRRLLQACVDPSFIGRELAEDIAICRTNRTWLESKGIRFAPKIPADLFSAERASDPTTSFGYHGVFNMPKAIGVEAFWQIYRDLDDFGTVQHDYWRLLREVGKGAGGLSRMFKLTLDQIKRL